jgi:hypothetical protein
MAKYLFHLKSLHVAKTRGKDHDVDLVSFNVRVGNRLYGPLGGGISLQIHSGMDIALDQFPPQTDGPNVLAPGQKNSWQIGPIEARDTEPVNVEYSFINTGDSSTVLSTGDLVKIFMAFAGLASGVGAAAAGISAAISAFLTGSIATLGEVIGDIFQKKPNCNGLVAADSRKFTGAELAGLTANGTQDFNDSPKAPPVSSDAGCGDAPEAAVSYTISLLQFESVKHFLGERADLTQGLKGLGTGSFPISVRSLIEPAPTATG